MISVVNFQEVVKELLLRGIPIEASRPNMRLKHWDRASSGEGECAPTCLFARHQAGLSRACNIDQFTGLKPAARRSVRCRSGASPVQKQHIPIRQSTPVTKAMLLPTCASLPKT